MGIGILNSAYNRSKIIIGKTYGIDVNTESVTTNGTIVTETCIFRKDDLTVKLTKTWDVKGDMEARTLTIIGEMDEDRLKRQVEGL